MCNVCRLFSITHNLYENMIVIYSLIIISSKKRYEAHIQIKASTNKKKVHSSHSNS